MGKIYLGNAYISIGKKEEGIQLIKQGYVEGIFGRSEQKIVISKFKSFILLVKDNLSVEPTWIDSYKAIPV